MSTTVMKEEEQDDKQVEHEEEEILKKSWFDFYVHPQQLEDHLAQLKENPELKPNEMDLLFEFLHQLEKMATTFTVIVTSNELPASLTPSPTPEAERPLGILSGPAPVTDSNRAKRLWALCEKLVRLCSFSLSQIESLPIIAQKKLILSLVDSATDENHVQYQTMLHHWILHSILNPDIDRQHILNPRHDLFDFVSEYTIDDIGKDSLKFLQTILKSNKESIDDSVIEDMAQFYFRLENFNMAKQLFQKIANSSKVDRNNIDNLMRACDSILGSEKELSSSQFKILTGIERLAQQLISNSSVFDAFLKCLLEDNVVNAVSLNYREELLATNPALLSDSDMAAKVIAANILKKLAVIMEQNETRPEQLSKLWREFLVTSKYFALPTDHLVASYTLVLCNQTLSMNYKHKDRLSQYMITMAEIVDDSLTWATLLTSCKQVLSEQMIEKYSSKLNATVRKQYKTLSTLFEKNALSNRDLIPRGVFELVHKRLEELRDRVKETSTNETKKTVGQKRKYEELIQDQHNLIAKQRKLSHESDLYVPYMLHNARQRLNNCSDINTLSYNHAAHMLHDVLSELKQQEMQKHSVKFDRSYEYDVILLNLAHKEPPKERMQNYPFGNGKPINNEEYEKVLLLTMTPPISFLVGLLRFLVNLDDWIFIRDYFSILADVYPDNDKWTRSPVSTYCAFCDLLQQLYLFSFNDQSSEDFLDEVRDRTFNLLFNLRSKWHNTAHTLTGTQRKQKNSFYGVVETQSIDFKLRMSSIFALTLVCLRRSVSKDAPVPGHYFDLVECSFSGDVRNPALGYVPFENWKGSERSIDEMLSDMLTYVLQQLIDNHCDTLCTSVKNCQYYFFTLGDLHFERKLYLKAILNYLKIGQELIDRNATNPEQVFSIYSSNVLLRMVHCLNMLGEFTAAAVLHQFLPISTMESSDPSQPKILGYDKRLISDLTQFNELDKKWLLYFWDLSYVELVVYIEHNKADNENEKLLLQHLQRSEMNMNNSTTQKKQFIEQMKLDFFQKLYIHIASMQDLP